MEREAHALPFQTQATLLGISRASLYYHPVPPSAAEVAIKHRIDELYTAYPLYGSRKIMEILRREGTVINRKRVQTSMREMGIAAVVPGPNLSKRTALQGIYPYLLRGITATASDHMWGCDSTYIRLQQGWRSLVVILDW